jgi:PII-like signaling protein
MQPLWSAIFEYLHHKRVAGANVSVPYAGFGSHGHVRRTEAAETPEPTVRIEFVETAERVDDLMPALYDMVTDGLIEVQETTVVKAVQKQRHAEKARPHKRIQGPAKMMRIFFGEADKWHEEPLYDAIVKRLRLSGIAGATVYKGVLGYGAKGHTHKAGILHFSRDLPVMITVVDSEERIKDASDIVEAMLGDGLIVVSDVEAIRLIRDAGPEESDGRD